MDSKIRKAEDNLITVGNGVMLFGVWTFLRFVLSFFILGTNIDENQSFAVKVTVIVVLWTVSVAEAAVRIYVGYAARCEGMRRKRLPYLVLTGILLGIYIIGVTIDIALMFVTVDEIPYLLIVLVIDVTSMLFLLMLMMNSVNIRKMRRQTAGNGEPYES